jgi:hypothetical protein
LGASLVSGALASLFWFMDWIPEFQILSVSSKPVVSEIIQPQNGILVAQVSAPESMSGKSGLILLFAPNSDLAQPPTYQQKFQLDKRGSATLLLVVGSGTYATLAFLDLNDNGQLDYRELQPLEPIRFPKFKASEPRTDLAEEESSPTTIVELRPRDASFCEFDFN